MTWHERNKPFSGKSIAQIAQQQGQGIMDTFLDIALADELRTSFQVIDRNTDPEAQQQILGSPYTVIGTTDGGARPDKGDRTDYNPLAGLLGTGKAGDVAGRRRLSDDGQDCPDARSA